MSKILRWINNLDHSIKLLLGVFVGFVVIASIGLWLEARYFPHQHDEKGTCYIDGKPVHIDCHLKKNKSD